MSPVSAQSEPHEERNEDDPAPHTEEATQEPGSRSDQCETGRSRCFGLLHGPTR